MILPRTFRSAYNILIVDEDTAKEEFPEQENTERFYPIPTGKFKESQMLLMHLFNQGCVQTDPRNKRELTYYMDYDNPGEFFGKESIIELPNAPTLVTNCSLDKVCISALAEHPFRFYSNTENGFARTPISVLPEHLKRFSRTAITD
ncbi:hypothetical protein SCT18_09775 [Legionella pneumophila serogroup 1]